MNGITNRRRRGSIQPAALGQRACEQARTSIPPFNVVAELYRLLEALQHDRMARLETHRSGRNEVRVLAGEEFAVDGHAVAEANHVGVDPPAALLGEKLVSEIVRERRWRSLAEALGLIDEDLILRNEFGGVADPHSGRNGELRVVGIEIDRVSPIGERSQAKQLVGGERPTVPE